MKAAAGPSKKQRPTKHPHDVSDRNQLVRTQASEAGIEAMLEEMLDAAIDISGADFANIQLTGTTSATLRIVAQRGFPQWWVDFWNDTPGCKGSCGLSLERGERVIVEDIEQSPILSGAALEIQRKAGVRAIQSTPLVSRSGEVFGVFSTHYKRPHRPDERTLHLLDLLARHAAAIIEYGRAKAAQRASEERLRRMLDTETIAVLFWDHTGTLIDANHAFLRMTGHTRAEVEAHKLTWRRMTPSEWVESSERQLEKLAATGHIGPYEKEYFLKDGSRRWMMFVGRDLGDGSIVEYCIDITDRKRMEEERKREGQRKDEFLSLLSHELRNPLTAISFATDMLRSDITPDRRASLEETIARQVGLLQRLVNDLLDLARITHGQISLKKSPVDLTKFLQCVGAVARSFLDTQGQKLVLRLPSGRVQFMADGIRLEQVVMNLVNNASKYSGRRARIELSGAREASEIVIRCKDNGPGIPLEMQKRIFEPFTCGPMAGNRRGEASLGIGLALAKQLTELHGGSVSLARCQPRKGSEFVVRLPLEKPPTALRPRRKALPAAKSQRPLSILIVEDNLDVAQTMRTALEHAGHKVTHFADGPSALSGLPSLKPNVALIDIGLPGMDGYELVAELRKRRNLHRTMFVAISGLKKRLENGKSRANFDHYLEKPVQLADLLTLIERRGRAGSTTARRAART